MICEEVDEVFCQAGCMAWQTCQDCIYWCTITPENNCDKAHYIACSFTDFRQYLQIFIPTLAGITVIAILFYYFCSRSKRITIPVTPKELSTDSIMCPQCGTIQIPLSHAPFFRCASKSCSEVLTLDPHEDESFISATNNSIPLEHSSSSDTSDTDDSSDEYERSS